MTLANFSDVYLITSFFPPHHKFKMSDITETVLKVSSREDLGRSASRNLRKQGSIPAVFYGKDKVKHYTVNDSNFRSLLRNTGGSISLLELDNDSGYKDLALLKDLQIDSVKDKILHIDFQEVTRGQDLVAKVPLVVEGEAEGVKNMGGILEILLNEIEVKCRPSKLPSQILVNVTTLNIGQNLQIKNLTPIEGVEFTGDPLTNLVSCVGSASGRAGASSEDGDAAEPSMQVSADESESTESSETETEQS